MTSAHAAGSSITELIALGEDRYLTWGSAPDANALGARQVPVGYANHVLRAAFRSRHDVRTRVLALHRERTGASPAHTAVAVLERDLEWALSWALGALDRGPFRLHVLERVRPRIDGHFAPNVPPPPRAREAPAPESLHHLEFEVLDQNGNAHVRVPYQVKLKDEERNGTLGKAGYVFIDALPAGSYEVKFPAAPQQEPAEGDFIDIELLWAAGVPLGGFAYVAKRADGSVRKGVLDKHGRAHLAGVPPGEAEVTFPALEATKNSG